jgi:RNA polymerase sigma-70 factor, ECF subfamily
MDPETFEATFAEHYAGLARRLSMIVRDEAEGMDLAQEAYLRAFRDRHRFDGRDPRAWIYVVGYRLALNEVRRRRRQAARLLQLARSDRGSEQPPTDPDLWRALGLLSRSQRAALLLSVVDGYTHAEVAQLLGASEGTVASWISRAKAKVRTQLERVDHGE